MLPDSLESENGLERGEARVQSDQLISSVAFMRNNPSDNARALLAVPLIPGGKDGGLPTMGWDEPRVAAVQLLFWPWPEKASSSGRLWKAHVQKRKPSCFMSVLGLCCSRRFHRHCCFDPQRNRARWLGDYLLSVSTKGESKSRSRHSLPWLGVEREREYNNCHYYGSSHL